MGAGYKNRRGARGFGAGILAINENEKKDNEGQIKEGLKYNTIKNE